MTPQWIDPSWSPFGVASEPVYEAAVEPFGQALHASLAIADLKTSGEWEVDRDDAPVATVKEIFDAHRDGADGPVMTADGLPVIEWEVVERKEICDGDTVRVTQVGRWKGTRLVGKTTHYERKTVA